MAMAFARPSGLRINGNKVTDHNRSEIGIDVERIETRNRMANGTMRKYWVADKRTITVSWTDVPKVGSMTVDGFWSGAELKTFLDSPAGRGSFELRVYGQNDSTYDTFLVMATSFSYTVKKRWATWELWDFSLTMEQV